MKTIILILLSLHSFYALAGDYTLKFNFNFKEDFFNNEIPKIYFSNYCDLHFYSKNGAVVTPGVAYNIQCAESRAFEKRCTAQCTGTLKESTKKLREMDSMRDVKESQVLQPRFDRHPSLVGIKYTLDDLVSLNKCIINLNTVNPSKYKKYEQNLSCLKKLNIPEMEKDVQTLFKATPLTPKEQNELYKRYVVKIDQFALECMGEKNEMSKSLSKECDSDRMLNVEGFIFNFRDRQNECLAVLKLRNRKLPAELENRMSACSSYFYNESEVMRNESIALQKHDMCAKVINECMTVAAVIGPEVNDDKRGSVNIKKRANAPSQKLIKDKSR